MLSTCYLILIYCSIRRNGNILIVFILCRSTLQSKKELTAPNARSIKSTRSLSTKLVRLPLSPREREDMMLSRGVSVVRLNPSSERRQRPQRRLLSSSNAEHAREEECAQSRDARHSCSERKKQQRVAQSSDLVILFNKYSTHFFTIILFLFYFKFILLCYIYS